ncbi:DNA cytosine methyltransferase [Lachnoclostridium phytofermentans]|uniref:Cytosine-specific methyltransferase n=1 Tax=Lachnoclostridium phytofermentans (strain ATCC 700394 / DSM 18823 / ISDg) TaxID=357809 RepID=A9KPK8_LACP7|nr:DNA cytosine methyltransferase [Lachnoclostridium phytofermentans]ABX43282.1 DNA-cytosine methyltransferase [Lachnoclostridium phytofermentans ISDg]
MKVADFFCGAGGFSEGFRQAGFDIVFAVDKWLPAVNTYKANKPMVNVIQDDVIRISNLPDEEFEKLVPDTEVIIGSPPCVAFSNSNKSGKGDKTLGIQLLEAYLRIVARKKFKKNSILKYWVLENVPNIQKYIKKCYSAADLNLEGNFKLNTRCESAKVYNAKYFGAPTNRKRFLCGDFPAIIETKNDNNLVTLGDILKSLGTPLSGEKKEIIDYNYNDLILPVEDVTDHQYIYKLQRFEWETAKRLKEDRGYMGKMTFPENLNKPARTVMATMSTSSREAMILGYGSDEYRLPTVREAASLMSFPIDYRFYGNSIGVKYTLVGNAVPPKLSYAVGKSIMLDSNQNVPLHYIRIKHDEEIGFINLNYTEITEKKERKKKDNAKFKYHIPYLINCAYRVELTNYHSAFEKNRYTWSVELHYSQGKKNAACYTPRINEKLIPSDIRNYVQNFVNEYSGKLCSFSDFQKRFCMPKEARKDLMGPYELLNDIRKFMDEKVLPLTTSFLKIEIKTNGKIISVPLDIYIGYYLLKLCIGEMRR